MQLLKKHTIIEFTACKYMFTLWKDMVNTVRNTRKTTMAKAPQPKKKKKKRIRRVLLTTCNKGPPCVQPPPPLKQNRGNGPSPRFQGYFFKIPRRRRQRERQKAIRWIGRKTTVHAFFTLFCIFLYRHYMTMTLKCLISRFTGDVNKRRRNFLSLSELEYGCLEFGSVRVRLHFTK